MKKFSTAAFFFLMSTSLYADPPAIQKISPRVRLVALPPAASSTLLSHNLPNQRPPVVFLSSLAIKQAPRIAAFELSHDLGSVHQSIFATGELNQISKFDVIRNWQKIIDPVSGQLLGLAGLRIGKVELVQEATLHNPTHTFLVTHSTAELSVGDVLLPALQQDWPHVVLDRPSYTGDEIHGRVATLMREGLWAGSMDVVALNVGSQQGIKIGMSLSVMKQAKIDDSSATETSHPPVMQNMATLFVFDVSELAAFALVMQASDVISTGDKVVTIQAYSK
jgi:hypothetical protein